MEEKETKKYSYEELEEFCRRATSEVARLQKIASDLADNRGIQRLEFLFKVVENNLIFADNIVEKAVNEIASALFPTKEDEEKEVTVENE